VVSSEGSLEQLSVMESPSPLLESPILNSLRKWVFIPARLNGTPVAAKILMGIPLWSPE